MTDMFNGFFSGQLFEFFAMYRTVAHHADVIHLVPNVGRDNVFKFYIGDQAVQGWIIGLSEFFIVLIQPKDKVL